MDHIMYLLGLVFGSSGLSAIIVAIINNRYSRKSKADAKLDAIIEANKVFMIDRIRYIGESYINRGSITLDEKENVMRLYAAYKGLNGNGDLDTVMAEINKLPIKEVLK